MNVVLGSRIARLIVASACVAVLRSAGAAPLGGPPAAGRAFRPSYAQPVSPARPLPASFMARVEQAATQPDPAVVEPIAFDVTFGVAVDPASFEPSDITPIGSATVTTWTITDPGDHAHFSLAASGVTPGTVIPTIAAGAVLDAGGQSNSASISTDNSVTFGPVACTTLTYLYVGIWSPPEINVYCIEADGSLTFLSTVAAPADVRDLQPAKDGHSLFYAGDHLTKYAVSTDGSLAAVGTVNVGSGSFDDLTLNPNDPTGRFLYGTHSKDGGKLYVYDTLAPAALPVQAQVVGGFYLPRGVAITPDGDHIHVANYFPEQIFSFSLNANATVNLGSLAVTDSTARPSYFALHPALTRLYFTQVTGGAVVVGLLAGTQVTPDSSIFSGFGAKQLAIDGSGSHLYVANYNADQVAVLQIGGAGGLTLQQLVPTARRPEHLVFHPSGAFLYVASAGNLADPSTVSVFAVQPDGSLVELLPATLAGQGAYRLAVLRLTP